MQNLSMQEIELTAGANLWPPYPFPPPPPPVVGPSPGDIWMIYNTYGSQPPGGPQFG